MSIVRENTVKRALAAGKKTSGAWLHLCSPMSAEVMADAGFDWLLIDMEHGHGDLQTLVHQLMGLRASATIPIVRVPWNDPVIIKRILDCGAYGIMVPWVNTREQCEAAVAACKYPPAGVRGMAGSIRAAGYGRWANDYKQVANDAVLVIIQIETRDAVHNVDAILGVPGVDVAFIGPVDLSTSYGYAGDFSQPEVQAAIAKVEAAAMRHKVATGIISANWDQAKSLYDRGFQMVTLCSDVTLVWRGALEMATQFRQAFP